MKERVLLILCISSLISINAIGQQSEFIISGKYESTPFDIFVTDIERQIPVQFMYHPKMLPESKYVLKSESKDASKMENKDA